MQFPRATNYRDCRGDFFSGFIPKAFLIIQQVSHKAVEIFDQGFLPLGGLSSTTEEPHQLNAAGSTGLHLTSSRQTKEASSDRI